MTSIRSSIDETKSPVVVMLDEITLDALELTTCRKDLRRPSEFRYERQKAFSLARRYMTILVIKNLSVAE